MSRGGARSRSGPLQDPNALRRARKDDAQWITLPSGERLDAAPDWPLTAATDRELTIWERWWRKPVSILWEQDDSVDYVALTVRMFAEAEITKASAENRKTVRMMMADLYLTHESRERAKIKIAHDELAAKRDEKVEDDKPKPKSARDRMKVVNGDGG